MLDLEKILEVIYSNCHNLRIRKARLMEGAFFQLASKSRLDPIKSLVLF